MMGKWLQELFEKIAELTPVTWAVLAVFAALAAGMFWLLHRRGSRNAALVLWIAGIAAVCALIFLGMPQMDIDTETGRAALPFLYRPIFWSAVAAVMGLTGLVLFVRRLEWSVQMMAMGALCIALAFILSNITIYRMPQGGRITPASMLPVMMFAWIYGAPAGMAAGTVNGILQLLQGGYVLHPFQFLLDYILPFAMLGVAGFFKKEKQLPVGIMAAGFGRFVMHFLSGMVFFGMYAAEGQSAFMYSLLYNGSYMLPDTIICLVLALVPQVAKVMLRIRRQALGTPMHGKITAS